LLPLEVRQHVVNVVVITAIQLASASTISTDEVVRSVLTSIGVVGTTLGFGKAAQRQREKSE